MGAGKVVEASLGGQVDDLEHRADGTPAATGGDVLPHRGREPGLGVGMGEAGGAWRPLDPQLGEAGWPD
jgi:hypothetical protein